MKPAKDSALRTAAQRGAEKAKLAGGQTARPVTLPLAPWEQPVFRSIRGKDQKDDDE